MIRGGLELILGGFLLASCVQPTSDDDSQGYTPSDDDSALYDDDYTSSDDDTVGDDDVGDDDTTGNLPPIAEAGGPYEIGVGEYLFIDFGPLPDGTGSYSQKGGALVRYTVLWGDGGSNSGSTSSKVHLYFLSGVYPLELTVEDECGATDSDETSVIVN